MPPLTVATLMILILIRWVPCPASLTGGGTMLMIIIFIMIIMIILMNMVTEGGSMLLYFKPGSHPWDTRIQVKLRI